MKSLLKNKKAFGAVLGVLIFLVVIFLPTTAEIQPKGKESLGILLLTVSFWVFEVLPVSVTSLLAILLLPIFNVISYEEALSAFGSKTTWLVFAIFIISRAISKTSLDKRIAYNVLKFADGKPSKILFFLILTTYFLTLIIPSPIGRVAVLAPISAGIIDSMKLKSGSNIAKSIMLSISFVSLIGSGAVLTASTAPIIVAEIYDEMLGFQWDYLNWLIYFFPVLLLYCLILWAVFMIMFPPEVKKLEGGMRFIKDQLEQMGKLSIQEIKLIILLVIMFFLWITKGIFHDFSIQFTGLFIALTLVMPGINILDWDQAIKSVNWSIIFIFVAGLAITTGLEKTEVIFLISENLTVYLEGLNIPLLMLVMIIGLMLIRLGFANISAYTITLLPVTLTMATGLGINPAWLGLSVITTSVLALFYPMQSLTILLTYASGIFTVKDMLKVGSIASLLYIILILFVSMFYWPILGMSP